MYEAQPIQKEQRVEWLMLAAVAGLMNSASPILTMPCG